MVVNDLRGTLGPMDVDECVLSAGRAVLEVVEREWQPLSPGELEQRLDQAVEEVLEAELMARLKSQPPPTIYVQLLQNQATAGPRAPRPAQGLQEPRFLQQPVGGEALKVPLKLKIIIMNNKHGVDRPRR